MVNGIAKFEKVSFEQFAKDWNDFGGENAADVYERIKLPKRATSGSAGYDFFAPVDITIEPGAQVRIPTGIRVKIDYGWVLMLFPRSSLGFKYRLQLNNTVGIIDSDYYEADNEGHCFVKLTNDTVENKTVSINAGDGMVQGIFVPFGVTVDDDSTAKRTGGFGSTNKERE